MKKLIIISISVLFLSFCVNANPSEVSLNKILKKDGLLVFKKDNLQKELQKNLEKKKYLDQSYSLFPSERKILNLLSSLWLVHNKNSLKWDKQKTKYVSKQSDLSILYHNDKKLLNFILPLENKLLVVLNSRYMKLLDLSEVEEKIMINMLVERFKLKFSAKKIIDPQIYKNMNKKGSLKREFINISLASLNKFILQNEFSLINNEMLSRYTSEDYIRNPSLKSLIYKKSLVHSTLNL